METNIIDEVREIFPIALEYCVPSGWLEIIVGEMSFENDLEYIEAETIWAESIILSAKESTFLFNNTDIGVGDRDIRVDEYTLNSRFAKGYSALVKLLRQKIDTALAHAEREELFVPRISVLSRHLELDAEAENFLRFVIVSATRPIFEKTMKYGSGNELKTIAMLLGLSAEATFSLTDSNHPLFKNKIVTLHTHYGEQTKLAMDVKIEEEYTRFLCGANLTAEDYFQLNENALLMDLFDIAIPDGLDVRSDSDYDADFPDTGDLMDEDEDGSEFIGKLMEIENEEACGEHIQDEASSSEYMPGLNKIDITEQVGEIKPYSSDLEFLEAEFQWLEIICLATREKYKKYEKYSLDSDEKVNVPLHEAKGRIMRQVCDARILQSKRNGFVPRLEKISRMLKLSPIERNTILLAVGLRISMDLRSITDIDGRLTELSVRFITHLFTSGLEDQLNAKKYFSRKSKLIRNNIIMLDSRRLETDLLDAEIQIDRRLFEYILGNDSEVDEYLEGSNVYHPSVKFEQVELVQDKKDLIVNTIYNYPRWLEAKKKCRFDETISYGNALVMLFHGPSGTGKTMTANAIANHLKKRLLLIDSTKLDGGLFGSSEGAPSISKIFREARLSDAIVFFDECESILEEDVLGGVLSDKLLIEFEKFEGIVIMATNKSVQIVEAMQRRISLSVSFDPPGPHERKRIWETHMPRDLNLSGDVDFKALAMNYELNGGLIKNAVLSALNHAVSRMEDPLEMNMADLEYGAKMQLKNHLTLSTFDLKVTPSIGLDKIVLPQNVRDQLLELVQVEKSRKVLNSTWGFGEHYSYGNGVAALFHGLPGTGKTFAAEAIGYETGKPLKVVSISELISCYVGETGKNLDSVFREAAANDAILMFDEADALFSGRVSTGNSTDKYSNMDTNLLLRLIERHKGLVILTSNLIENIDYAFFRRFRYVIEFPIPTRENRAQIWRMLCPPKMPLNNDVNFDQLAAVYSFTGGEIKNAILRAATRAALQTGKDASVTMQEFIDACEEVQSSRSRNGGKIGFRS